MLFLLFALSLDSTATFVISLEAHEHVMNEILEWDELTESYGMIQMHR